MDKQTLKSEWGYSSFRFFPKELHPTILKVGQKKFTDESRFEHHDEIELILIRSGTGTN